MIDDGIVEPSVSPWGAPCLLIAKQTRKTRFVVDYRQLNKCTEFDAHALPTTEDALETFGASQLTFFSTLDLKSGFYQVEIARDVILRPRMLIEMSCVFIELPCQIVILSDSALLRMETIVV